MANEAALIAKLEVKLDKFERDLDKAGLLADRNVKQIEDRFSRANPSLAWATTLGTVLGGAITAGVNVALGAIERMIASMKELQETARITGLAVVDVLTAQGAGKAGGVSEEQVNRGLQRMAESLERAKRGENNGLAQLFSANNIDIKKINDVGEAWRKVADLVANAANPLESRAVAELATGAKELEGALRGGSAALDAQRAAAEELATKYAHLNEAVAAIGATWDGITSKLVTDMKGALDDILRLIKESGVAEAVADLFKGLSDPSNPRFRTTNNEPAAYNSRGELIAGGGPAGGGDTASSSLPFAPPSPSRRPGAGGFTKLPDLAKGGGRSGGKDTLDAFEREERRARERTQAMEVEARLVGQTTEQRVRALETLRLEQMANRENLTIDEARRAKIEQIASAQGRAAQELERALQSNRQFQELQSFAGNTLVDALDRATQKGADFKAIMEDVVGAIKRAALQALILGQGPLAGLFGTSGQGGQTGGLLGLLTNSFRPGGRGIDFGGGAMFTDADFFASGTRFAPGGLAVVGEKGPELINLPRGSQVFPADVSRQMVGAGGGNTAVTHAPVYNISGDGMSVQQIGAMIAAYDKQSQAALLSRLRTQDKRFG